jgi:hypothetical protein
VSCAFAGALCGALSLIGVLVHLNSVVKFHNQTLRFLLLPSAADPKSTLTIIDGCNAADFVLFGLSSEEEVGTQAETTLRSLTGTGVGNSGGVFGVVKARRSFGASFGAHSLTRL